MTTDEGWCYTNADHETFRPRWAKHHLLVSNTCLPVKQVAFRWQKKMLGLQILYIFSVSSSTWVVKYSPRSTRRPVWDVSLATRTARRSFSYLFRCWVRSSCSGQVYALSKLFLSSGRNSSVITFRIWKTTLLNSILWDTKIYEMNSCIYEIRICNHVPREYPPSNTRQAIVTLKTLLIFL